MIAITDVNATDAENYWLEYINKKSDSKIIIYAKKISKEHKSLEDVVILIFDENNEFILRVDAKLVTLKNNTMILDSSAVVTLSKAQSFDGSITKLRISEKYFLENIRPIEEISSTERKLLLFSKPEEAYMYAFTLRKFVKIADNLFIYGEGKSGNNTYKNIIIIDNRNTDNEIIFIAEKLTFKEEKGSVILLLDDGMHQFYNNDNNKVGMLNFSQHEFKVDLE